MREQLAAGQAECVELRATTATRVQEATDAQHRIGVLESELTGLRAAHDRTCAESSERHSQLTEYKALLETSKVCKTHAWWAIHGYGQACMGRRIPRPRIPAL